MYDAIQNHVNEPKPWRYAGASLNSPEGWMIAQMDRAYRQGNKNYKPIYRTIGGAKKIVGFIDNTEAGGGKKYISAKEFIKGNDADGVLFSDPKKGHVDYANTKKFTDVAQKIHGSPSKVITDILGKGGIDVAEQNVKLKHVLNYLVDKKGLNETMVGMVKHHKGGVFGAATQDYQILNRVINNKITGIEDRIRADQILPEDIAKLKKWGASVSHKGVTYGGGPKTAIGGLKAIENLILKGSKDVELYGKEIKGIEKWNKKDFTEFNKHLQSFCGYGKSTGGRIGFKSGSCSPEVAKRNFLLATNDVANGKITGEAAEQIAKNAGKVVAKVGSKSALATLLGPAGIGIDVIYEVGSVGTDMLMNNVSFKEAMQNNWLTGAFMRGTGEEEYHKGLTKKYSEAKPYARSMDIINRIQDIEGTLATIEADPLTEYGERQDRLQQELESLYKELDVVAKAKGVGPAGQYGKRYTALEHRSPEQIAYDQAKLEYDSGREAKAAIKRTSKAGFEQMIKEGVQKRPVPFIDFSLIPEQYGKYNKNELDKILKNYTYGPYVNPKTFGFSDYGDLSDHLSKLEATHNIAQAGGISKLAGGGMVGIRKPNAIAPTGGPMSQGLRSLYINDKDY